MGVYDEQMDAPLQFFKHSSNFFFFFKLRVVVNTPNNKEIRVIYIVGDGLNVTLLE